MPLPARPTEGISIAYPSIPNGPASTLPAPRGWERPRDGCETSDDRHALEGCSFARGLRSLPRRRPVPPGGGRLVAERLAVHRRLHHLDDVFVARSKIHEGTKSWDMVLVIFLLLAVFAIFPIAALDARFDWSAVPPWLVAVGYLLMTVGYLGSIWVYGTNKFAEPTVRIQKDRGQSVISTGPYAIVRHPLYAWSLLLVPGFALALGSYWAMVPGVIAILILVARTAMEDRTLHAELEGYKEYASRVRYRLIPGIW
jgi:protein-S-isoprenylcysteine O-methyltransferase Ste14